MVQILGGVSNGELDAFDSAVEAIATRAVIRGNGGAAGILLYRLTDAAPEVLPVHPGGPFWAKNDDGAWSIPAKTQSRHPPGDRSRDYCRVKRTQCTAPMRQKPAIPRRRCERVKSTLNRRLIPGLGQPPLAGSLPPGKRAAQVYLVLFCMTREGAPCPKLGKLRRS